jgi:hypothetical protein
MGAPEGMGEVEVIWRALLHSEIRFLGPRNQEQVLVTLKCQHSADGE